MSSTALPKGWELLAGTVGTDIVMDYSNSLSGGACFKFPSTATADAQLVSAWMPMDVNNLSVAGSADVSPSDFITAFSLRASANGASDQVNVTLQFANADRSSIGESARPYWQTALPGTNTWYPIGGFEADLASSSQYKWVRVAISRPSSTNFDLWFDNGYFGPAPSGANLEASAGGTFSSFSYSTITNITGAGLGSYYNQVSDSGGVLTLHHPGIYVVHGSVLMDPAYISPGDVYSCRLECRENNSAGASTYRYGSTITVPSTAPDSDDTFCMTVSGIFKINGYMKGKTDGSLLTPGNVRLQVSLVSGLQGGYAEAYLDAVCVKSLG